MAQTPNIIGITVLQRLKETGEPATPENYERVYYEVSGLPRPPRPDGGEPPETPYCAELLAILRGMAQDMSDTTENLARNLGEKNKDLSANVDSLKTSRDKQEILRLLSAVVTQSSGIQSVVEASHKEIVEARQSLIQMQEELSETRQLLNEDALTGALNRRGLEQTLGREIARCHRTGGKFSLAMLDLDYFKRVNDAHGHEAGDQMLIHFTGLIRSVLRKSDAVVRYGGEEFTLLLPDTDARGGMFVLGRLQQLMRKTPLYFEGKQINTTFSAGLATLHPEENGHALLRRADEALLHAKQDGRDRVTTAS
ncbi:MAG: GGDEF domain-containing protein [Pseudomonadota bacterium]